jgi:hypothetical protein
MTGGSSALEQPIDDVRALVSRNCLTVPDVCHRLGGEGLVDEVVVDGGSGSEQLDGGFGSHEAVSA